MNKTIIYEKNSTIKEINALALSDLERSRALVILAKADALVGAYFALSEFFSLSPRRVHAPPSLKLQK